jgi:nucleoid-associated protein YgaU
MDVQKAIIYVRSPTRDRSPGLPAKIKVQFNPTEYTKTKSAQIAEIGIYGIDSPILQFVRGQNEKLTMDLFFDTTLEGGMGSKAVSVTTLTNEVYQLVKIQPKTHALPLIEFVWSEGLCFKAIVESVQQRFTLFSPQGLPLRATLSVTFRQYRTLDEQLDELHSADHTRRHVAQAGETLSRIAAQWYDDPRLWRPIAEMNPQVDVRRLEPGTLLLIPALERSRPTGGGR